VIKEGFEVLLFCIVFSAFPCYCRSEDTFVIFVHIFAWKGCWELECVSHNDFV